MTKSSGSPVLPSSLVCAKRFFSACDEAWLSPQPQVEHGRGTSTPSVKGACRRVIGAFIWQNAQGVSFHHIKLQVYGSAVWRLSGASFKCES